MLNTVLGKSGPKRDLWTKGYNGVTVFLQYKKSFGNCKECKGKQL
jgi:hypothetical protein